MFTLTVSETLLFKGKSVLAPAQRVTGSERVNWLTKEVKVINNKDLNHMYSTEH